MQVERIIDLRRVDDVPHLQLADVHGFRVMVAFPVDDEIEAWRRAHAVRIEAEILADEFTAHLLRWI